MKFTNMLGLFAIALTALKLTNHIESWFWVVLPILGIAIIKVSWFLIIAALVTLGIIAESK
jgi:hypothetical protein